MFSVSLHLSGRAGSSATLPASDPRNCGHWSDAATLTSATSAHPASIDSVRRIVIAPIRPRPCTRAAPLELELPSDLEQPSLQDVGRSHELVAAGGAARVQGRGR